MSLVAVGMDLQWPARSCVAWLCQQIWGRQLQVQCNATARSAMSVLSLSKYMDGKLEATGLATDLRQQRWPMCGPGNAGFTPVTIC